MLSAGEWRPPIIKTEATTGRGVPELWAAIKAFRAHSEAGRHRRRKARGEFRLRELLTHTFLEHVERDVLAPGELEALLERIAAREIDPYSAAADIPAQQTVEAEVAGVKATPRSHRHCGQGSRCRRSRSIAMRSASRSSRPRKSPSQRVRAHFIPVGESALELLEATADDSAIARYVEKRGPGIHHITLRVDDIDAALARLREKGVRLVDESPRRVPKVRWSRSCIRQRRTACWSS